METHELGFGTKRFQSPLGPLGSLADRLVLDRYMPHLSAAEFTAAAAPDAWRRYLAIVLDGMRARAEDVTEPLGRPPLDPTWLNLVRISAGRWGVRTSWQRQPVDENRV